MMRENEGMMSDRNRPGTSGIGLAPILFVVFLVLKLTHTIDWSWWWVTAPLWGGTVVYLLTVIVVLLGVAFVPPLKSVILRTYERIAGKRST